MEDQNPFGEGFEEAQAGQFIKWSEVGQKCEGICIDIYERENKLKGGEMQTIVVLEQEDGTTCQVALKDDNMKGACKKLLKGQHIGFFFAEIIPAKQKGYNDYKSIKVYLGQLDPAYQDKIVNEQPF